MRQRECVCVRDSEREKIECERENERERPEQSLESGHTCTASSVSLAQLNANSTLPAQAFAF